jgi:hypothetical protein
MNETPKPGTPLPWVPMRDEESRRPTLKLKGNGGKGTWVMPLETLGHDDAAYIIHAANSLPALEARVKELEDGLAQLASMLTYQKLPEWAGEMGDIARSLLSKGAAQ